MGLLADAFGEGAILIKASVDNRSAAIELAGELLVASGKANQTCIASMLEAVEKFGPYIVIAPGIALAHGKPGDGVIETGLSLLMLESPIELLISSSSIRTETVVISHPCDNFYHNCSHGLLPDQLIPSGK